MAFAVHIFTASGAAVAFGALIAAIQGEFTVMFALLGVALLIDGVDGFFARRLRVAEVLPRWSGEVLDHVIDYLTYVFIPALALATGAILPEWLAVPAALAIVVSSALYFADKEMKTDDGFFRGFPVLWNLVVFYLFLIQPPPFVSLVIVAVLIVLTFVPFSFVHPLRARRWAAANAALLVLWGVLAFAALTYHLVPPPLVVVGLLLIGAYFIAVGLVQTLSQRI
ncbi:MAG TPA: phosphatidylcholine synthase [Xanthobacteraceae bacterium]|nr:phosphatidylcholine synthase [Xanthobacteraceae bacterium]